MVYVLLSLLAMLLSIATFTAIKTNIERLISKDSDAVDELIADLINANESCIKYNDKIQRHLGILHAIYSINHLCKNNVLPQDHMDGYLNILTSHDIHEIYNSSIEELIEKGLILETFTKSDKETN